MLGTMHALFTVWPTIAIDTIAFELAVWILAVDLVLLHAFASHVSQAIIGEVLQKGSSH